MSIVNKKNYIIAVSGGPDSIALLHMYHKYVKAVCTVNYHKRVDSDYDVECVRRLCKKYNLIHEVLDVTQEMYDQIETNNFQNKARIIRYNFFKEIAHKYHAEKILVAHHLDDFLETAYFQMKNHSELYFYGIKELSYYDETLLIYRPLIRKYRKSTLIRYCNDYDLKFAVDSTNESDMYQRNIIRKIISSWDINKVHDFLKQIDKHNKQMAKQEKHIEKLYSEWENENFDVRTFKHYDSQYQPKLVYRFLIDHSFYRPSKDKINGIIEFIYGENGMAYRLSENQSIAKVKGKIIIKVN